MSRAVDADHYAASRSMVVSTEGVPDNPWSRVQAVLIISKGRTTTQFIDPDDGVVTDMESKDAQWRQYNIRENRIKTNR